jgi:lysophospholipase L1-like esterase
MSVTVEKCLQAWTNSLRQMNAKADFVFFGDSLTYYGDFASVFPDKVVCNLGLRGDTIQGMIDRVEQVKMLEPKQVFLMAGINDVAICSVECYAKQYEILVQKLKEHLPNALIIIQSLLPVNDKDFKISCNNQQIVAYNEAISRVSYNYRVPYIDLFTEYANSGILEKNMTIDGIHLKPSYYQKWINCIIKKEFNK